MTVSSTENRVQFNCDGSAEEFPFTFPIYAKTDLVVILVDSSGAETELTVDTQYTVTIDSPGPGGDVTLLSEEVGGSDYLVGTSIAFPIPAGYRLVILRSLPVTQLIELDDGDRMPAETLEEGYDRAVMILQDLTEAVSRTPKLSPGTAYSDIELPEPDAGKYLGWNPAGNNLENKSAQVTETGTAETLYVSNYESLAAAISDIGATETTLVLDAPGDVDDDLAFPATLHVRAEKRGVLTVAFGKTLTISGPLEAGEYQIFAGTGTVTGLKTSNVKWFGATGDGITADTTAVQASITALADGGKWIVPPGTYAVANVVYDVANSEIDMQGTLKPIAETSGYTILIGHATSGSNTANVCGTVRVDSGGYGSDADYDDVEAIRIQNLTNSNLLIEQAEGCKRGIMVMGDGAGCAYNQFYLGRIYDNNRNIDFLNAASGYANENKFFGGRFGWASGYDAGAADTDYCNIYIPHDGTNNHNGITFYAPSLEGDFQFCNIAADYIQILDARTESANLFADKIYFASTAERCVFSNVYSSTFSAGGLQTLATAGGGITIAHDDTNNAVTIVGAGDLTPYFYRGALAVFTIDAADDHTIVLTSAYTAGTDTNVVRHARSGVWTSANVFSVAKSMPVYNAGNYNKIYISRASYPSASEFKMLSEQGVFHQLRGGMFITNLISNKYPCLVLMNSSSSAYNVFEVLDSSGKCTFVVDGNGYLTIAAGTEITGHLSASTTWNPAEIADGAYESKDVTVTGAATGDTVAVGFAAAAGWIVSGYVSATNTVTVTLVNHTGAPVNLGEKTLRVDVWKH